MTRTTALLRRLAPLLLVCVIAGEGALSLAQDARNHSLPPPTHHHQFMVVYRLARTIAGWEPMEKSCAPWSCNAGFETPPALAAPRSWTDATRWLWDQGNAYPNHSPLHGLPAALFVVAFPGSAAVAALGLRLWFALLLVGVYRLGTMARGPLTGLLAATLAAGTPGLFAYGQLHADTTAIATVSTWLVVALLASEGLRRKGWVLLAALLLVAGFRCAENASNALSVWVFATPAACAATWSAVARPRGAGRQWRGLAIIGVPAALLGGWVLRNASAMSYITNAVKDPDNSRDWLGAVAILPSPWFAYVEEVLRDVVRFPLLLPVGVGLWHLRAGGTRHRLQIFGMFLLPLALLTASLRLGTWYIVPALPGLLVPAALGLGAIRSPRWRVTWCTVAVLAACWMRGTMVYEPRAALNALTKAYPNYTTRRIAAAFGPQTVVSGDELHGRPTPMQGAAAVAISRLALDTAGRDGKATRVLVLTPNQHLGFATCWVIRLEAPDATCVAPISGWLEGVPPRIWDPDRYDLVAWVNEDGMRPVDLRPGAPLPPQVQQGVDQIAPADRHGPEALLLRLHDFPWEEVVTPQGPVYRRLR